MTICYKKFYGLVAYCEKEEIFKGKVIFTNKKVTFKASTAAELKKNFHAAVDKYLADCKRSGKKPLRQFDGSLKVKIDPWHHMRLAFICEEQNRSMDEMVDEILEKSV